MSFVLVTAPTVEPLTLQEAKDHLRVDHEDDDALIDALITAARQQAEIFCRRSLLTQTWDLFLDCFPDDDELCLPRPPLQSVAFIKYLDLNGVQQTFASSNYRVDTASTPGQVTLAYGAYWPSYQEIENSIQVRFVAGYGDFASAVPRPIAQALLLMIGGWYEDRSSGQAPVAAQQLLWTYRASL